MLLCAKRPEITIGLASAEQNGAECLTRDALLFKISIGIITIAERRCNQAQDEFAIGDDCKVASGIPRWALRINHKVSNRRPG
jgi:hypothetical protein